MYSYRWSTVLPTCRRCQTGHGLEGNGTVLGQGLFAAAHEATDVADAASPTRIVPRDFSILGVDDKLDHRILVRQPHSSFRE